MNKKMMFLALIIILVMGLFTGIAQAEERLIIERFNGNNRIETAIMISKDGWDSSNTIILARAEDFPDAMTASTLAYYKDAPLLLTPSNNLSFAVKKEISRLGAEKAIIVGGAGAVSPDVERELKTLGIDTERVGGSNRYETAKLIADKLPPYDKAIVTYGRNFPDALAIGPFAAQKGYPILLTETESIPRDTAKALAKVDSTIIIGGESVISKKVEESLPSPGRIAGVDRYDTASKIINELKLPTDKVYIATGLDFADALTGSVLAAKNKAPILLVKNNSVPSFTLEIINHKTKSIVILGGDMAVDPSIENGLKSLESQNFTLNHCSPSEPGPSLLEGDEEVMVKLVNEERTKRGIAPLKLHTGIRDVARIKSKEMIELNYFSHYSPVYGSPFDMISYFGYDYWIAGENLALNICVYNAHQALMNSPGHKNNILNQSFTHIGIGAYGESGSRYYTQMFYTPK